MHQIRCRYRFALPTSLMPRQQAARQVSRLQQDINHRRQRSQFAPTQFVQQGFHVVRQLRHVGKAERRSTALDRMRTAKNAVELFVRRVRDVHVEQELLHEVEVFPSLLEEDFIELAQVEIRAPTCLMCFCHELLLCSVLSRTAPSGSYLMTLRTISIKRAGSNGLTSHPVAPAARPACFI